MTSPLDTINLVVIHRNQSGKSDTVYPYNGDKATHMAACVNLARRIIASERALSSLTQLGNLFEEKTQPGSQPQAWYKPKSMEEVAKKYVDIILTKWPLMVDDHTFTSSGPQGKYLEENLGHRFQHPRSRYHDEWILWNFDAMCKAGRQAKGSSDLNSKEHQRYRTFVVLHACTMVHELGHIFITFLSGGETNTPDGIANHSGGTLQGSKPEAGAHLECLLFGGAVLALRNFAEGDEQSGELHLIDDRDRLCQISQDTVDKTCRYELEFPFPTEVAIEPERKISVGYAQPAGEIENPLKQPETKALLAAYEHFGPAVNPFNWKDVETLMATNQEPTAIRTDPQSAVYRLPFEPGLLAEAAK